MDTTVVSIAAVFFKKVDIIIATYGKKKKKHWQLSKVILSGIICITVNMRQYTRSYIRELKN